MKKLKNNKVKQCSFDGCETMKMKYHNNEDFFDVRDTRFLTYSYAYILKPPWRKKTSMLNI